MNFKNFTNQDTLYTIVLFSEMWLIIDNVQFIQNVL